MIQLQSIFGGRLNVLGVLDVDSTKAQEQLKLKKSTGCLGYTDSKVWKTLEDALPDLRNERIDLAILGIPPHFRGSILPDADLDMRLISKSSPSEIHQEMMSDFDSYPEALPQVSHWLVEKPISAKQPSAEAGQAVVANAWQQCPAIVGVGYHLASLKAVTAAMKLIKDKNLKIMSTQARYNMAYEFAVGDDSSPLKVLT